MFRSGQRVIRVLITLLILVCAASGGVWMWNHYLVGPWTRDGQVQANVVNIAPEVSGRIITLSVGDNQFVRKGDLLYEIDPFDYQVALAAAQSDYQSKQASLQNANTEAERRKQLGTLTTSVEERQTYTTNADVAQAAFASSMANLSQARINLQRTKVVSPVNGYISNLLLHLGDYATKGTRNISVLDSDSFWVAAYFEETKLHGIHIGDPAAIGLMGFDAPLKGHVDSIARGISSPNYDPGTLGLASVSPVFTWVRLAQRIPVRIHIDEVPEGVLLAAGETATVTVGARATDGSGTTHGIISRLFSR